MDYWKKILKNPDAAIVKIADIKYNLSDSPSDHARVKYEKALKLFAMSGYSV